MLDSSLAGVPLTTLSQQLDLTTLAEGHWHIYVTYNATLCLPALWGWQIQELEVLVH